MESKPLITSKEVHELVKLVLKAKEQSVTSVIKYYEENPFKPYVGATSIKQAYEGEDLTTLIRNKFQRYIDNTTEEERLKPLISQEEIYTKVREVLKNHNIPTPKHIERKISKNPFEGYVGKNRLYDAYLKQPLTVQTRKSFAKYFKDNS